MAAKAAKILSDLLKKAGITIDAAITEQINALTLELPDEVETELATKLFTFDAAKNNALLKNHFKATALNPMDAAFDELLSEVELSDQQKAEFKKLTSTYDKPKAMAKMIKDLEAAKAGETSTGKKALQAEIDKLNEGIKNIRTEYEGKLTAKDKEALDKIATFQRNAMISKHKFAEAYKETGVELGNILLNNALKEKGITIVSDENGNMRLVQAANPDLDYLENNSKISVSDFAAKIFADKKMLEVTDQTPKAGDGKTVLHVPKTPTEPNQPAPMKSSLLAENLAKMNMTLEAV